MMSEKIVPVICVTLSKFLSFVLLLIRKTPMNLRQNKNTPNEGRMRIRNPIHSVKFKWSLYNPPRSDIEPNKRAHSP